MSLLYEITILFFIRMFVLVFFCLHLIIFIHHQVVVKKIKIITT